jgi:hypothetical protein
MGFFEGWVSGNQNRDQLALQDAARRRAIEDAALGRKIAQQDAQQRMLKATGLLPAAQAGDQGAQLELAAMGLMQGPESPEQAEARRLTEQNMANDNRRADEALGLQREAGEQRKVEHEQGVEERAGERQEAQGRWEADYGFRTSEAAVDREERTKQREIENARADANLGLQREEGQRAQESLDINKERRDIESGKQLSSSGWWKDEELQQQRIDHLKWLSDKLDGDPAYLKDYRRVRNDLMAAGYRGPIPGDEIYDRLEKVALTRGSRKTEADIEMETRAREGAKDQAEFDDMAKMIDALENTKDPKKAEAVRLRLKAKYPRLFED